MAERREHELELLLFPFQKNTITLISAATHNVPCVRDKNVSQHLTRTQKSRRSHQLLKVLLWSIRGPAHLELLFTHTIIDHNRKA